VRHGDTTQERHAVAVYIRSTYGVHMVYIRCTYGVHTVYILGTHGTAHLTYSHTLALHCTQACSRPRESGEGLLMCGYVHTPYIHHTYTIHTPYIHHTVTGSHVSCITPVLLTRILRLIQGCTSAVIISRGLKPLNLSSYNDVVLLF